MDFKKIERKWQKRWEGKNIFAAKIDKKKKKYYVLEMFPYPSGKLHMGHVRNYVIGDTFARFKRMQGFNVLYPTGYDSFGLPAENAAIQEGVDPVEWTENNIKLMEAQQKTLGFGYDWSRKIATCNPEYYKWNQWIFLKFFEKGLVYRKKAFVNWCPKCNTVLANEQVHDGRCWRCSSEVEEKELEQWFLKITDYAQELLDGLKKLEHWPERVKVMQENWIGKSEGVNFREKVKGMDIEFEVYDSIPQTFMAQTFAVIAPEHPLVKKMVAGTEHEKPVMEFVNKIKKKGLAGKFDIEKETEGIFTGRYVENPFGKGDLPIWVASFVVTEYGTGIVNCSAHDERDFAFAKKYGIPLRIAMLPPDEEEAEKVRNFEYCYYKAEDGIIQEPKEFKGMTWKEVREPIIDYIEKNGLGKKVVNYKLRDWLISRQRYWGTPIPIIYCDKCGIVPEKNLPVLLPKDIKFTSGNPLETSESFKKAKCPKCGGEARRETDTMDTFVDSSWYFLRYCSPHYDKLPFDKVSINYWMPVDQYIGGIEHACMHLIYARFFTKALRGLGLLNFSEPFTRLLCQGMVIKDGAKMSKSIGNIVTPEEVSNKYNIDTARVFILFTALPEKELEWSDEGVQGSYRFLNKVYGLVVDNKRLIDLNPAEKSNLIDEFLLGNCHRTIKEVTEKLEKFEFNLALSRIMGFVDDLYRYKKVIKDKGSKKVFGEGIKNLILLLSPLAPHLAEELWSKLGKKGFVSIEKWPEYDKKFISEELYLSKKLLETTLEDVEEIKKLSKIKPRKIHIFVASPWKYKAYDLARESKENLIERAMGIKEIRENGEIAVKYLKYLMREFEFPEILTHEKEKSLFRELKKFFEGEANCKITITDEQKSDKLKAKQARPMKPALYLE